MTAGRPRKYEDPEEFERLVDAYFEGCATLNEVPSMTGLSLVLGFADRQSFTEYEKYGEAFSLTVKRARSRVELDRQNRLVKPQTYTPGLIFDLKNNHGWKDTQQQEHSGSLTVLTGVPRGADH